MSKFTKGFKDFFQWRKPEKQDRGIDQRAVGYMVAHFLFLIIIATAVMLLLQTFCCDKAEPPPDIWFGRAYDVHGIDTVVTFLTLKPDSINAARARTPGRFFIYAYGIPAMSLDDGDIFHGYCYGDTLPILFGCKFGNYLVMKLMEGAELPDGPTVVGIRKTDGHP